MDPFPPGQEWYDNSSPGSEGNWRSVRADDPGLCGSTPKNIRFRSSILAHYSVIAYVRALPSRPFRCWPKEQPAKKQQAKNSGTSSEYVTRDRYPHVIDFYCDALNRETAGPVNSEPASIATYSDSIKSGWNSWGESVRQGTQVTGTDSSLGPRST